jgi:S-adenosylmethionine-diacylglycerol 3-amino-3-carboxypropyl transferase
VSAAGPDELKSENLARQKEYYLDLEEKIFSRPVSWLIRQPWCMAMVGVPKAQIRLLEQTHPRGLSGYVQDKLKQVMTELPFQKNYFWRVYLTGSYSPACCPNYLKKANFDLIKSSCQSQNSYLSLTEWQNTRIYTHFILLDHQTGWPGTSRRR